MSKAKSGGGYTSNKVVHSTAPKAEPKSTAINPGGAAQLGSAAYAPKYMTPLEAGRGYSPPVGPTNNMGQGPGAGRQVPRSGSQAQHGPVAGSPRPQGSDILSEFGPDIPGRK